MHANRTARQSVAQSISRGDLWEPAKRFVDRLKKVRERADGSWVALCPSHPDKTRSLSVRVGDQAVVLNCFAGCSVEEIVSAAGLKLQDLYPPPLTGDRPIRRFPPFPVKDFAIHSRTALTAIGLALHDLAAGRPLTEADTAYLLRTADDLLGALDSIESAEGRR